MASNSEIMNKLDSMDSMLKDHGEQLARIEGQHAAEEKIEKGNRDWAAIVIAVMAFAWSFLRSIT